MRRQHACLCSTLPVAFCPISAHHRSKTIVQVHTAVDAEVLRQYDDPNSCLCEHTLLLFSAPAWVGIEFVTTVLSSAHPTNSPKSRLVCISNLEVMQGRSVVFRRSRFGPFYRKSRPSTSIGQPYLAVSCFLQASNAAPFALVNSFGTRPTLLTSPAT
jgi:hypothetical protein